MIAPGDEDISVPPNRKFVKEPAGTILLALFINWINDIIKPPCFFDYIRVIIQSKQNNSIFSDISLSDLFKEVPA